jgi:hypothetical protein
LPIIALFLVFQLAWEAACKAFSWAVENIIKPAVNAVAAAFQWVWNTIVQPIFNFFVAAWNALGAAFAWVQAFVIKPTIDALAAAVQWVWNYVVNPVFAAFRATWEALGMAFRWVNDTIIQPTWQALQAAFQAGWNFIRDFVINPLRAAWQAMGEFFNWVKVNIIDKVWEGIKSGISAVRDTFSTVVDAIRAIWDGIKKVFGTPVKFVLEKVVIPLMKGANFILDKVGLGIGGEIGSLEGMARDIPSFARGGLVPGRAHGPGDNQLAFVRSGEWILTDRQVAAIGIANLRRLPRFSEGGLVGDDGRYGASDDPWAIFEMLWLVDKVKEGISAVGGGLASAVGAAWEGMTSLAGDLINTATGLIRFAAAAAFEAGTIPLKKLLEMVPGDTPVAGWISKFGIYIIDEVVKLIKGKSDKEEFLGGGLGIDQVVAMIRERFPQLVVTSALRPGDPGYHGKGLARDLGGPANVMAEAAAWTQLNLVSALLEGIHRGLGGKNLSVKNGKPVDPSFWGASTWAGHADHLHLASEATALSGPVSGSVAQWAAEGIRLAGVGQEWLQPLITRAMIESGGDPRVTQKIQDINSARGDPAKGLMQFISGTWRAYAAPGMTDIFNPIHAMVAAIRYVSAKPGGLAYLLRQNALRQGYDAGGWLPTGTSIAVNNTGRPEPVLSAEQWDRLQAGAAGPAIQINQATFAQEVDVELLLRKAAWYLQTRSA